MTRPPHDESTDTALGAGERIAPPDDELRRGFLAAHPEDSFLSGLPIDVETPVRRGLDWRAWVFGLRPALAMASVLIAVVAYGLWPGGGQGTQTPGGDGHPGVSFKGRVDPKAGSGDPLGSGLRLGAEVEIGFAVKRGDEVQQGAPGMACRSGDALRLSVTQQGFDWALAFSVDRAAEVTLLYADARGASAPVARGRGVALPGSRELDDYLGPEWYLVLLSKAPLEPTARQDLETRIAKAVRDQLRKGVAPPELRFDHEILGLGGVGAQDSQAIGGFWIEKR